MKRQRFRCITGGVWIWTALLILATLGAAQENPWELGNTLFQQKKYAEAAVQFEKVIDANPAHPAGYYMLALCQIQLNQLNDARKNLEMAQKLLKAQGQEHFGIYYQFAVIAMKEKDYARVTEMVSKALPLATNPGDKGMALKLRARAYYEQGQLEQTVRDLEQARKLLPDDTSILYFLGRIAFRQKDYARAYQILNEAYTRAPNSREIARLLLEAAVLQREFERAVEIAEPLVQRGVQDPSVLFHLGTAYLALKRYADAATVFAQLPDTHPFKLFNLAQALVAMKKWDEAERVLKQWQAQAPDNPKVYELLGYVYENKKQPKAALENYEKAFQLSNGDARYKEMIERAKKALERQNNGSKG